MTTTTRRQFVTSTATAVLASPLLSSHGMASKPKPGRFTIGLSQYSLRALIKDGSLDPLDYPQFSVDQFGIRAIDLWEGGLPAHKLSDAGYLAKLRARAADANTDLFLLMTGALDASPAKRAASQASLRPSIDRAKQLGCRYLRIFLRAPGNDVAAGVKASVEALKPFVDAAAKQDVMVVIEPGASKLSSQGTFLASVAKSLDHPHCRLMPDFGKLKNNVYDGTAAMLPYTETISAKMHSFDANGKQPHFDYVRLLKLIKASDYSGILAIEWEGSALKPVAGVKASQKLIADAFAAQ